MLTPKKSTAKKAAPRGRGRPPTHEVWRSISVRFLDAEKEVLAQVAKSVGLSQAEFIRRGAVTLMEQVKKSGSLELTLRS